MCIDTVGSAVYLEHEDPFLLPHRPHHLHLHPEREVHSKTPKVTNTGTINTVYRKYEKIYILGSQK